jgi:hypothetical protein
MKTFGIVLALAVTAATLSPLASSPPARMGHSRPAPHHDCCCPSCPGLGLCPCDPGATTACLRSSDDLARDVASPHALPPLKLACEQMRPPPRPDTGRRCDEPERFPHFPISESRLEKVPISFA